MSRPRISVGELMVKEVVKVDADSTLMEVAKKMREKNVGCVVVCEGKKPVGIITEWDIMEKVVAKNIKPGERRAKDVMSAPLISVNRKTDVLEAFKIMRAKKIRRLPVVEGGKLLGIISLIDMVSVFQRELAAEAEELIEKR
ncbi:MAG: CBS domain-containing protein [Candidatus Hadarchaeales archaeon]